MTTSECVEYMKRALVDADGLATRDKDLVLMFLGARLEVLEVLRMRDG